MSGATVEGTINQLVEMGFSKEKAEKALNKTGWSGVEAAMEWLLAHPGKFKRSFLNETFYLVLSNTFYLTTSILIYSVHNENCRFRPE